MSTTHSELVAVLTVLLINVLGGDIPELDLTPPPAAGPALNCVPDMPPAPTSRAPSAGGFDLGEGGSSDRR